MKSQMRGLVQEDHHSMTGVTKKRMWNIRNNQQ